MDPLDDAIQRLMPDITLTLDSIVTLMKAQDTSPKAHCEHLLGKKMQSLRAFTKSSRFLELQYDQLEQYGRRNAITNWGIQMHDNATTVITDDKVFKLATDKLQLPITESNINRSHRIGSKRDHQSTKPSFNSRCRL